MSDPLSLPSATLEAVAAARDCALDLLRSGSSINFMTSVQSGVDRDMIAVSVTAILTFGVLAMLWMRGRARLEAKRIDVLRELASRGQISATAIDAHLRPRGSWRSGVLVLAWFGLFGGGAMIVVGMANGWWGDAADIGSAGIAVLVASLATLSAPIALRELRKQSAA